MLYLTIVTLSGYQWSYLFILFSFYSIFSRSEISQILLLPSKFKVKISQDKNLMMPIITLWHKTIPETSMVPLGKRSGMGKGLGFTTGTSSG